MVDIRVVSLGIPSMPSLVHVPDFQRIGEAAGRSLFPCFPQVDTNAMVWLCSPHDPLQGAIPIRPHSNVPDLRVGDVIGIPPVKPCRRRRHSSPQMRVNRFVFLNLPILSHGDHLGVTASPQSPFPTGYVTLPVDNRSPPLGLMPLHSKEQGSSHPSFRQAFQTHAPGLSGRGAP